jgi:outer membrane protein TolC
MKPTIYTNYLATVLILVLLSWAAAQDKQGEAIGDFFPGLDQVASFQKSSMRTGPWQHWSSFQGHQDPKTSKLEGSHYRQSKKFHKMHHEEMTVDKSEELLRLHQINTALQEEKLSNSANTVKS